jgi:hypothetical protein
MCTLIVLARPGHPWPMLLAANRDEMKNRPWDPPAAFWPDHPGVVAGRDRLAGGTWFGVNHHGVAAAVLNRPGSLGPAPGRRSRGELPLLALDHPTAAAAIAALSGIAVQAYRTFNLVVADASAAYFLRGTGREREEAFLLAPGLHMITSHDPNDLGSPRTARHLPRFLSAAPPDPGAGDWSSWLAILGDRSGDIHTQMNVPDHATGPRPGYATVSTSLLALRAGRAPVWEFAPGPPDVTPFAPVSLGA